MTRLPSLVAAALLTAFGACSDGQPQEAHAATIPAAEQTQVALELPGMD